MTREAPPLLPFRQRPRQFQTPVMDALPELHVTLGRDRLSSGLTITVWLPTGGQEPNYRTLYSKRWLDPILSAEEALRICAMGVAAAIAELYDPPPEV